MHKLESVQENEMRKILWRISLEKLKKNKTVEHESDDVTNCSWCTRNRLQTPGTKI